MIPAGFPASGSVLNASTSSARHESILLSSEIERTKNSVFETNHCLDEAHKSVINIHETVHVLV
jgi:hypothetical protein